MRRYRVLSVTVLALAIFFVAATADAGDKAQPFATIGPALVKGDYHQYPPFYGTVIAPHAVVAEGKVYCAFQDTKGRPVVMAYDIRARSWEGPLHASQFGLGKDAHGNPSICIDRQGTIHIFYGCHGRAMKHTASTKPYDITKWQEQSSPTPRATYPQSMRLADGSLFLFYRAGGHMEPWSARVSRDNGATWSDAEKVIEMRTDPPDRLAAAYASICPGAEGKTVHCFWVHKDDNAARVARGTPHPWRPLKYPGLHEAVYRYNMYYIVRDAEGTWRNIEGEKVKLPVSKAYADGHCLVYDSGDEFTSIGFPFIDAQNRPYVRFRTGVGDWKAGGKTIKPWHSLYASYAEGKWQVSDRIPSAWPVEAKRFAAAEGSAAFGPKAQVPWFIYYTNDKFDPKSPSKIFLYHLDQGYATRPNGPARLP
jgi:hypothetical protein